MLVDLHVVAGDDGPALDGVFKACAAAGLDGLCLVGQGKAPPMDEARRLAAAGGLAVFFGVEFAVDRGRLMWIPEDPAVLDGDWRACVGEQPSAADVSSLAGEIGGIVVVVQPYDRRGGPAFTDGVYQLQDVDAVEIANAGQERIPSNLALEAALRRKLSTVAGTGSLGGITDIGRTATVLLTPVADQAGLVEVIRAGDTWAVELLTSIEPAAMPRREQDDYSGRDRGRDGDRGPRRDGGRRHGGPRDGPPRDRN